MLLLKISINVNFVFNVFPVICGALIAKKISVRMVTLIGALIFLGFAVASLFIDPYEENHLVPDVEVMFENIFMIWMYDGGIQ